MIYIEPKPLVYLFFSLQLKPQNNNDKSLGF